MPNIQKGHIHPIHQFISHAAREMAKIGFEVVEGPEVVNEYDNFDALRVPADHPARDVQDTFWTTDGSLLRTQTSAMQIPAMKNRKPPVRILVPGKVYRNEATDSTHEAMLYQLEGFAIDKNITMENLKWTIEYLLEKTLGKSIETKFFPHHYPFVEPGMDMMIKWHGRWLEILGSGMIHPEVLENMGVDPNKWQGFAFGAGADRLMMLQREITEIRLSYSNDLRFLKQF